MLYITIPETHVRRLSFYLAAEEYVARFLNTSDDCFFMWQVNPTVIFGRNQLIENEVNLDYCRTHGIETYRRKSGGGCVYADMSNIMFSYITRSDEVQFTFSHYIAMVVAVLQELGLNASTSGRNDILIGDKKVSGNAFYHIPGHSIVHGTMLYDTHMQNMVGSITPSDEKLLSKGVESVRQHITLLKDHLSISLDEFKSFVKLHLCTRELILSEEDIAKIEELEKEYLTHEFIYGHNPKYTLIRRGRIEGVGELEIRMELKNNEVKSMNLMGDFFLVGDVNSQLIKPILGAQLSRETLQRAVPDSLGQVIMNLGKEEFISLLLGDKLSDK